MSDPYDIPDETPLERSDTGIRLLLTLLFFVIKEVVETVLAVLVIFSLAVALLTRQRPSRGVRDFSNAISAYLYGIYRYLTYNESRAPFPFAELPAAIEPDGWSDDTTESELFRATRGRRPPRKDGERRSTASNDDDAQD